MSRAHPSRKFTRHARRFRVRRSERGVVQTIRHRVVQPVEQHRVRDPLHRYLAHILGVVKAEARARDLFLHQSALFDPVSRRRRRRIARHRGADAGGGGGGSSAATTRATTRSRRARRERAR